ncbi:uroporphyrinogen-III C-methyltransferase [Pelistega sp. MC2]|nr:uroporphyrinogen-III C-methyltransferase [Pelistega sp. MC2]
MTQRNKFRTGKRKHSQHHASQSKGAQDTSSIQEETVKFAEQVDGVEEPAVLEQIETRHPIIGETVSSVQHDKNNHQTINPSITLKEINKPKNTEIVTEALYDLSDENVEPVVAGEVLNEGDNGVDMTKTKDSPDQEKQEVILNVTEEVGQELSGSISSVDELKKEETIEVTNEKIETEEKVETEDKSSERGVDIREEDKFSVESDLGQKQGEDGNTSASVPSSAKGKGGSKLFLGTVLLAALAGGGYYYYGQLQSTPPESSANQSTSSESSPSQSTQSEATSSSSTPTVSETPSTSASATSSSTATSSAVPSTATEASENATMVTDSTTGTTTSTEPTVTSETTGVAVNTTTGDATETNKEASADANKDTEVIAESTKESVDTSSTSTAASTSTGDMANATGTSNPSVETATVDTATEASSTEVSSNSTQTTKTTSTESTSATSTTPSADSTTVNEAEAPAKEVASEHKLTLEDRFIEQTKQIAQLTLELEMTKKQAQQQLAEAKVNQSQQSLLTEVTRLFNAADFERSVTVSKTKTLQTLALIKSSVANQPEAVWAGVRQAVEEDEAAINASNDVDLDSTYKATQELEKLLKVAPFVSAENSSGTASNYEPEKVAVPDTEQGPDSTWLDKAVNQVQKLPAEAYNAIRSDLGGLVKVEKLSNPDTALLSIDDVNRQRMETALQLSIAQQALLKRDEGIWQEALAKVGRQLETYYNLNIESTQQAVALTKQLQSVSVKSTLPALSHTQRILEQVARELGK